MDFHLSPNQRELIDLARRLAVECFTPRASALDNNAEFPVEDYQDLKASGLLGLCVPKEYGGYGADFETYCLVAEQLAQGNAATALTFNMHCLAMLMMGPLMDGLDLPSDVVKRHRLLSARRYNEVVENGVFYGQPHSEPIESGLQDQLNVGGRRFGTTANRVDDGYLVNGRKFFVSSAGAADYYATPALLFEEGPWQNRTMYLSIKKDSPGVSFTGDWDPLGMRATVSRDMTLNDVRASFDDEMLPTGVFGQLYQRQPHIFITFSAVFLGLMQAAYEFTISYLTGRIQEMSDIRDVTSGNGVALAEMLFTLESARALYYRAISEQRLDPSVECVQRARAAHVQIQRGAVQLTGEAIRICGGRSMLKRHPLERYYRDARSSAVMRPWTQDIATQEAWEVALKSR